LLGIVLLSLAATAQPASISSGQAYPSRPIRLIVPFVAGGTADVIARSVGNEAGAQFGQPLVLDNRGGANGIVGTDIVAKAPPDGHTLLHVTASFVINPNTYTTLPDDIFKDFEPVTNVVLYFAVAQALQAPRVRESIVSGGYEPDGSSPAEFRKFLRVEYERYAEMLRLAQVAITAKLKKSIKTII
jgi:tripartite-type tricarboxylate transporter receptor subunit TctC